MKKLAENLNKIFINIWAAIVIVIITTFLPVGYWYREIKLDSPLFVTEWLKICCEAILIVFLIQVLVSIRDSRLEKSFDKKFIDENILFFLKECRINLAELEKNSSLENCQSLGKKTNLCWSQALNFIEQRLYLKLNDKTNAIKLFYLHNELLESGAISHLNGYLTAYQNLDIAKIQFVNNILSNIENSLNKI